VAPHERPDSEADRHRAAACRHAPRLGETRCCDGATLSCPPGRGAGMPCSRRSQPPAQWPARARPLSARHAQPAPAVNLRVRWTSARAWQAAVVFERAGACFPSRGSSTARTWRHSCRWPRAGLIRGMTPPRPAWPTSWGTRASSARPGVQAQGRGAFTRPVRRPGLPGSRVARVLRRRVERGAGAACLPR